MQGLHNEHEQEVAEGGLPPGLEEADPEGAQEGADLRDCERDDETPCPGHALLWRQVHHKLLVSPWKFEISLDGNSSKLAYETTPGLMSV